MKPPYLGHRDPFSCFHDGIPQHVHGVAHGPKGVGTHTWQRPTQATVLARMILRASNPNRWIPWGDPRVTYRKWNQT